LEHIKKDAVKDLPPHVNHEPHRIATAEGTNVPFSERGADQHNVTNQQKHLRASDGTKGASVSEELMELAQAAKDHDDAAHFTANPTGKFKGAK